MEKDLSLTVRIDALDREFQAVVDEIVPSADPGSRTFLVKVSLPGDPGLYPGMFGRLWIPVGSKERIYVPERAVTEVGQLAYVLVKTKQGVVRRYIRLGSDTAGDRVEVVSGLRPGEEVRIPLGP
jgi:multidrug efflux pump subunit AcrA (membrane-fusion protein)